MPRISRITWPKMGMNYGWLFDIRTIDELFDYLDNVRAPRARQEFADALKYKQGLAHHNSVSYMAKHIDYPLNPGGHLIVSDAEGTDGEVRKEILNLSSIRKGLQLMAESKEYAHHWRDFLAENDDAITADVFLQFCLFGEVIYS